MLKPNNLRSFNRSIVRSVEFQTGDANADDNRHYIEIIALQTEVENDQNYLFREEAIEGIIAGFKAGQPLLFNHSKYGLSGLMFGQTIDARYEAPNLIVTAYILLEKKTPNGPYGDTTELKDFVVDGALKDASVSGAVLEAFCSICKLSYERPRWSDEYSRENEQCSHYRGGRYPVKNDAGEDVLQRCIVEITEFDAHELSLVWNASDDYAGVVETNLQMAAFSGSPIDTEKQSVLSHIFQSSQFSPVREPVNTPTPNPQPNGGNPVDVATLQAEKSSLEAQVSAKDTEITSLKAKIADLEAKATAKDTKIAELEAEKTENARAITDGEKAREQGIEAGLEAYTKAHPDLDEKTLEAELSAHKEFLETLTLEKMTANTKGYLMQAEKHYGGGRKTKEGAEAGSDPDKTQKRPRRRGA